MQFFISRTLLLSSFLVRRFAVIIRRNIVSVANLRHSRTQSINHFDLLFGLCLTNVYVLRFYRNFWRCKKIHLVAGANGMRHEARRVHSIRWQSYVDLELCSELTSVNRFDSAQYIHGLSHRTPIYHLYHGELTCVSTPLIGANNEILRSRLASHASIGN